MKTFFLITLLGVSLTAVICDDPDDTQLNVPQMIVKYGYEAESHWVTTEDGYNLAMHRIPRKDNTTISNGKVVFLQHGLLSSSADWIMTGPLHALAYLLADEGYDVWMGNNRGNHYSRNHTTLNPNKDGKFWDFSWHQIGVTDLPTMIDYVLNYTKQEKLFYIGHSQGTTTYYILTSTYPQYNDKIIAHFSLAPIAFMNHMVCPLMRLIAPFLDEVEALSGLIGLNEFLPSNELMALLGKLLCADEEMTQVLCSDSLFLVVGWSPQEMNATIFPTLLAHTPAGSSRHQLVHYAQEFKSGHFRQYDYGLENIVKYGQLFPPEYEIHKITSDIYLMYSDNDWMSAVPDVNRLAAALPNVKGKFLVPDLGFNHLDYMYGIHAKEYVYDKVISLMGRY